MIDQFQKAITGLTIIKIDYFPRGQHDSKHPIPYIPEYHVRADPLLVHRDPVHEAQRQIVVAMRGAQPDDGLNRDVP